MNEKTADIEKCETCRFWQRDLWEKRLGDGLCRRYPDFILRDGGDWCGEHTKEGQGRG